jgi:hypothetical protein
VTSCYRTTLAQIQTAVDGLRLNKSHWEEAMLIQINNPNAITCWDNVRILPSSAIEIELIVETDLITNSSDPRFNSSAFDDLVNDVVEYMKQNAKYIRANFHSLPEALELAKQRAVKGF